MRRPAVLLCLLVALTGTPLRQAEAAGDLSRSFAELFEPANIEPPDGGVGDDPGVGTLAEPQDGTGGEALWAIAALDLPPSTTPHLTPPQAARLRHRIPWPQRPPSLRCAWLQTFLF